MKEKTIAEAKISLIIGLRVVFTIPMILLFVVMISTFFIGLNSDYIVAYIICLLALIFYLVSIYMSLWDAENSKVVLTNQRVIYVQGGKNKFMPLTQVSGVQINTTCFGNKFNYGDLHIGNTGGMDFPILYCVKDAELITEKIHNQIANYSKKEDEESEKIDFRDNNYDKFL